MNRFLRRAAVVPALLFAVLPAAGLAAGMEDTIEVTSSAFSHHGDIPLEYTAYGDNVSPDLSWDSLPEGTVELALVMDDPVVPMPQPFVHWVAYNISPDAGGLPRDLSKNAQVEAADLEEDFQALEGMTNGINGIRQTGYFGPRPPADGKVHMYHFRIYALDADLDLEEGLNREALMAEIEGHILGTGMLMGHYERTD